MNSFNPSDMSNLSFVLLLKSHFYFNVSTGLLFRAVVKQAGDSAVGSGALHPTSATRGMHKRSGLPSAGKGVCVVFKGLKISLVPIAIGIGSFFHRWKK